MTISQVFKGGVAAAMLFAATTAVHAQTTTQVPFLSTIAGLPSGGSGVACTNDIPTYSGTHLGDGCLPSQAILTTPSSSAIDAYGNIYISDYGDRAIRVIYQGGPALTALLIAASPAIPNFVPVPGHIYTLAGSLASTITTTGSPKAAYCNGAGSGIVANATNGDGCPATQADLQPRGMSIDANGNVFVANLAGGEGMRVIYAGGSAVASLITTLNPTVTSPQVGYIYSITGSSTAGFLGDGANARTARFENVRDVVVDSFGNLFISDGNSTGSTTNSDVRMIYVGGSAVANLITAFNPSATPTPGFIYSIASGTATATAACPTAGSYGGDGGPAGQSKLNSPYAMFMDASSNLYIADSCNGRLRVIYAGGTIPGVANPVVGNIYTVAGGGTLTGGATNVPATQLNILLMQSAGIDAAGNLYVADNTNRYTWQINPNTGIATLYSGIGVSSGTAIAAPPAGAYCSGTSGPQSTDKVGDGCPALQASVSPSLRFIGDNLGHVYSIDNSTLRQYSLNNIFPATSVGSNATQPLAFTVSTPPATDTFTLQGSSTTEFSDAGGGQCSPVASTPATTLCIYNVLFTPAQAGARNGSIQLSASGTGTLATTLLSGVGIAPQLSVDPGTQTSLGSGLTPQGIAADLSGNLYVADAKANQVVAINIGNNTTTPLITGLNNPNQVAIDGAGNLFVADTGNNRIAEHPASGGAVVALGTGLSAPQGIAVDTIGNIYIADTGNNRIVEIIGGGSQITLPFSGLTKPTRISLSATNDIFVADSGNNRVVEFVAGQGQVTVNLGSTTVNPAGIATDAAGDLYIADATGLQVLELLAGTTTVNTVLQNLRAPVDLTAGPNASLYIADSQSTSAIALIRSLGNVTFPITNVNETSNVTFSLANTGNAALSFPGPQLASPTTPTTTFAMAAAAGNGCSVGSPVAPGSNCLLNASFSPLAPGSLSQAFSFTTNAANGAATQALLAGTGDHLVSTTTAISITSPTTSTIGFGAPVVLSTVVSLASNSGTPTGTITLSVDGQARPAIAFGTGTIPLTLNLPVGLHVVTAAFSGDSVYASSGSSVTFTVVRASTTTTLTTSPSTPGGTPTITFTAAVTSPTANGETGTVSFYAGTTLLSTSTFVNNSAAYTTSNITFPSNTFTAVYSGDVNFSSSTSAVLQPTPDFALTSSSSTIATAQGGVATASVTLTPIYGFSGVVTPSCSNLPTNTVCRFQPTTVSFSGNTPVGASIQIYTNVSNSTASLQTRDASRITFALVGPWGIGLLALFGCRRGKSVRLAQLLLLAFATLCAASGLSGCLAHQVTPVTPAGTQNVTVSFASSGGATPITHSLTYNLTVNTQ
jgi:hypothetical protein